MCSKLIQLVFFFGLIGISVSALGQKKYTISGNLKDASSGEDLIGATVQIMELSATGTSANVYGFYSITVPEGEYTVKYSFIGFSPIEKKITLNKNIKLDVELAADARALEEFVVSDEREDDAVTKNEMSVVSLSPKDIETIPVLFGEKDIVKVAQLSPGIKSAGEGNSGFFVRGGAADQNLILLDEAPVYNASHLLGFFSVFNSDAIKDAKIYKGGMPAEYGGRASSVMDIKMKDGNSKKLSVSGGIGLISSKLTVEAPIVKDKGSFIISGRRTYADMFLKLSKRKELKDAQLYFYDLTAKANYKLGEKDRVFFSGYFGKDQLGIRNQFGFNWGNKTGTLRWNHIFGEKLFSNTSLIFSDYSYQINASFGATKFSISSLIRDVNIKQDFNYYLNNKMTLKFGGNLIYHKFLPGELGENGSKSIQIDNKHALEGGLYIQNEYQVSEKLDINMGLRYAHFNYVGPSIKYVFDSEGNVVSKDKNNDWKSIQQYHGLEPRLNAKYQLNKTSSIKGSYNRNYQFMHLLSNSTSSQPNDVWMPSTNNIKPLIANQFALGYFKNLKNNWYSFSIEGYYKHLQNQLDYKDGANLFLNETVENQLLFGEGFAYGTELQLKKNKGKLTGWVGYTLSRSLKKIPGINDGKTYAAKQDRIHDIAIVAMYSINERLQLAANWVYYTGNAVTFPSGRYEVDGNLVPYYTERNGYRMPNYHRLDLGLTLHNKKFKTFVDSETGETKKIKKKFESSWNFSIYNAYARQNAYSITFRQSATDPRKTEAVQTTLFRIVPSVAYNFKF